MIHRPSLVRAHADVLSRRATLRGMVGLGLGAAAAGIGHNSQAGLGFYQRAKGGVSGNIPAGATLLSTFNDFKNAMYGGADGTNYVLAARTWEPLNDTFNARHTKTPSDPTINFYMMPGAIIPLLKLDGTNRVTFNYMTINGDGSAIGWDINNSNYLAFNTIGVNNAAHGFHTDSCTNMTLSWGKFVDAGLGVDIVSSQVVALSNILVDGFSADAMDLFTSDDITLDTYRCQRPTDPGGGHQDSLQISADAFHHPGVGCNRVTATNCVFDRGTSAFGPQGLGFCEFSNEIHLSKFASFGCGDSNGLQFATCTDSDATNIWMNSWDFLPAVQVRDVSSNITLDTIYAPDGSQLNGGAGPNTGISQTNFNLIAQSTSNTDRSAFDAFVATNGLPLASHWDNRGFL